MLPAPGGAARHPHHLRVALQGSRERARVVVLPRHPERERLEPPLQQERRMRVQAAPQELRSLYGTRHHLRAARHHPGNDIAVAVEILREQDHAAALVDLEGASS